MKPTVSVIIPTYNYAQFVTDAIASVRGQSLPDWECLVIDDGSTDNTKQTVEIIAAGDSRVRYFYQENKGLSAARNTGIKESSGEYLQFLDSDDLLESRKLEIHSSYLSSHPDVDIVYGDMRYFASETPRELFFSINGKNRPWMPKISGRGNEIAQRLIRDNIMVVSSPLIRRKVIDVCGLFDEGLTANEDWHYWIRCGMHGFNFRYLELTGTSTLIRYHPASMSRDPFRMLSNKLQMHQKLDALLTDSYLKFLNEKEIGRVDVLQAIETMRAGNRLSGLYKLLKSSFRNLNFEYLLYGMKLFVFGK